MMTATQERADTMVLLDELIIGIVRTPGSLEFITRKLEGVSQHLLNRQEVANKHTERIEGNARMLQDLLDRQNLLEEASRQQQLLSQEHYEQHVIEPLTRQLCSILDLCKTELDDENASSYQSLQAIHQQVLELLAVYGCEPLQSQAGQAFDPATMRPLEWHQTGWLERDRQVAESLQMGFRRGKRILRFESVALYRARSQEEGEA